MEQEKLTSRQMQAIATKNKIYKVSIKLMEQKGYNNIRIEDICKKAGVSTGSFYNYFKSKNDILIEIFKRADEYFENEVELNVADYNAIQKIIKFFCYYAKYNESVGVDTMKQLYNPDIKMFLTKGRYMQQVLQNLIIEGQEAGQICKEIDPTEINEYLFIAVRGIVYDWCLHDGNYNIEEYMKDYLERLMDIFKPKKS